MSLKDVAKKILASKKTMPQTDKALLVNPEAAIAASGVYDYR